MRAFPAGIGFVIAVSLIALAAVLGYRTGREEAEPSPFDTAVQALETRGAAQAAEFRAAHEGDTQAQRVRRIHPTVDDEGLPYVVTVVSGDGRDGKQVAAADLCEAVVGFLREERGIDFSRGHTELLYTDDGDMLRRYDTTLL